MIVLQNAGLLNLKLMSLMGANVKTGDSIGYFGTGLKYAIAVLLREKVDFKMYLGTNEYRFYSRPEEIRGKEFTVCHLEGPHDSVELSFTEELGRGWELWQAYRELHSNCLDEGGVIVSNGGLKPKEGFTTFCLDIDPEKVKGVFLPEEEAPLYSYRGVEVYQGNSEWIFYKGIRAMKLEKPSLFTYNITSSMDLTEDRLFKYQFEAKSQVVRCIGGLTSDYSNIANSIIEVGADYYETRLEFETYNCSPFFEKLLKTHKESLLRKGYSFTPPVGKDWPTDTDDVYETLIQSLANAYHEDFCEEVGIEVDENEIILKLPNLPD